MTESQQTCLTNLNNSPLICALHNVMCVLRNYQNWEFYNDRIGWIRSHILNYTESDEGSNIIQACAYSISQEIKGVSENEIMSIPHDPQ